MESSTFQRDESQSTEETAIHALYRRILDGWNQRSGDAFAAAFLEDGDVIGFDGSQQRGRTTIASELGRIFAGHQTPSYVGTVRSVRFLSPNAAVLQAVSGMIPPGQTDLAPQLNAVQTVVAVKHEGQWRAASFQNTPAQYHGRPELANQLTGELRRLIPLASNIAAQ